MSDPLRTDLSRTGEPVSEADREAKIEQLLLAGLDHYFVARYDEAINVWTRALFLDRSHARARAYIERARSALAERQRESEELLHSGVAAFDRGEAVEARRLLQAALNQGAPAEEALAILDRLNRLDPATSVPAAPPAVGRLRLRVHAAPRHGVGASRTAWVALILLVMVIVAAGAFGAGAFRPDWRTFLDRLPSPSIAPVTTRTSANQALALPRRGETALLRARALAAAGRLHDALAALDSIKPTDDQRADADRLRSDLQKQLITMSLPSPAAPDKGDAREP